MRLGVTALSSENLKQLPAPGSLSTVSSVLWQSAIFDPSQYALDTIDLSEDISGRTDYIARAQSANLLSHLLASMRQAAKGTSEPGVLTMPGDRLLILVGHDTNLANMSGALHLSWLIDGRMNDTPPGGALVFEMWRLRGSPSYTVRTYYTAQTLDQMRNTTVLSLAQPPESVPVFIPGCGLPDGSCTWEAFQQTVQAGIDSAFVK